MRTKAEFQEFLENVDNFDCFIELICKKFKHFQDLGSTNDFRQEVRIVSEYDYKSLDVPLFSIEAYQKYHCSHEQDCCGCISSQELKIVNNKNGYITIFINTYYNY